MAEQQIGGGAKKILYTLNTIRKMGIKKSGKALAAKNACKACALGMGGQMGGMTNELGEFPSVCNKSVQAQSSDIQPAIPDEVFAHSVQEFAALSAREIEGLGRLGSPVFKRAGEHHYRPISWDEAMEIAANRLAKTDPDRAFFYSSGRSSNEAGFLFQLLARLYGTNNVTNCSYYCHQATSEALGNTIGTGTSTVEIADLALCDLIFVIGANPASNHPRFIHQLANCRARGGQVIVINPAKEPGLVKFALPKSPKSLMSGGDEIASLYVQPKIGEDLALFKGIAKALLKSDAIDQDFIEKHSTGADSFFADLETTSWDEITERTQVDQATIEKTALLYAQSRSAVFAWGMGMTHHHHGVQNIEMIANLALMRGMLGRPGAGLLALRGHSNVQGIGTIGVKPVLTEDVMRAIESYFGVSLPNKKGLDTMASMKAADAGRIDAAVMMGGNLFSANPNTSWAEKALENIGFKLFLTTTMNHSHVKGIGSGESLVLPVTARDEEWEPTTQESMFNFVRLSDGGITRLPSVRPESHILADLAGRLFPESPIDFGQFKHHKTIRKAIAAIIPGMEKLADIDVARQEFHITRRLLHSPRFQTESGKGEFAVCELQEVQIEADQFSLSTIRSEGQFNSIIYEEADTYRGTKSRWSVLMNPQDMADMGIAEGDPVDLQSDAGKMIAVAAHPFDIPRKNLMAYYPEANVLTGTDVDPRSFTPSFKSTPVRIRSS
ncbi:MAG: FdhF/YdeP family oxidoreductase [Erythrobacter sp.]